MSIAKIIIDFDDTLFDTASLKQDFLALFACFGVPAKEFWETYKIAYSQNDLAVYNLARHIDIVCRQFPNLDKKSLLAEAKEILRNNRKYLINGAEEFLNGLSNLGVPLILLSLGDADFQKQKVESSGAAKFFQTIIFTGRKKSEVVTPLIKDVIGDIIFINDKIKETQEVAELSSQIKPILRMKTEVGAAEYKQSGLLFFKDFSEIIAHLKKNYV